MRHADDPALGVGHTDGVAGLGIAAIGDVARKDPGMAAGRAIGSLAVYFDEIQRALYRRRRYASPRMASRRAIRSSVEGWVENRRVMPPWPERIQDEHMRRGGRGIRHGDALHALLQFAQPVDQAVRANPCIWRRRHRHRTRGIAKSPSGSNRRRWAPGSPSAVRPSGLPSSSSRRPPPNHMAMYARCVMAAASVAAIELVRISRCSTCPSSCATTPSSSRSFINCRIPAVNATEACDGFRPVAKALGEASGNQPQFGHRQAHALD